MKARLVQTMLASGLLWIGGIASAGELRQSGPHVHGISQLDVALEGDTLEVSLAAPGHNIVGFEHPPYTPEQTSQLAAALGILKLPTSWLVPARAAGCSVLEVSVEPHGYDVGDKPASETDDHTDIDAHYRFRCASPASLDHVDVELADFFPETKQVVVELVMPDWQGQQVLENGQHRVLLKP
jgi:hypothetical protein